ncbi:hypothetical protein BGZ73_004759 [Actinomortierella ambigua]|nr:hypothetical protein BGZ73_004759 [Actinomortierella ambigua]
MDSLPLKPYISHSILVLGKSLGKGAFGAVHEARWGNQPCAAKTFFPGQSDLDQRLIKKEISLLQNLRYRHVIQFYRTHEERGRMYLLMELAEKGSLARAITTGELGHDDWPTKKRLAGEMARGLAYIHQEGVLHRDLKSANVLLTNRMEVKLADFGLAKDHSMANGASSMKGGLTGTLRWIAPELLCAIKPEYSTKSDMYALGMVMWEMAANCTQPFKDIENNHVVALNVSNGSREQLPEDTPKEYRGWVEWCWQRDPQQRPEASELCLLYDEAAGTNPNAQVEDEFLSVTPLNSIRSLKDHCDDALEFKKRRLSKSLNDHIGQLPPTDDDVMAHLCISAKQGSIDAQLFLGWIYEHGRGVDKSDQDAFWWYHLAAYQGTEVARFRVARMYEAGQGVEVSDEKAASWYWQCAEGGNAEAQYRIGEMYADGRGVKQDDMEAAKWPWSETEH